MTTTASGPAARDVAAHTWACRATPSWDDRCRCTHLAVRHGEATHASIPAGPGRTCTGRNLAGRCRDCPCAAFTPTPTAA